MPFGSDNSLDQLSAPPHWWLGPTSSIGDALTASYKRQQLVDSAFGMQVDVRDEYLGQLDRVQQVTGQNVNPNWAFALDGVSAGITRQVGQQIGFQAPVFTDLQQQAQKEYLAAIDRMDQAITQGKQNDPSLKTFSEVFQDALKRRQDTLQTAESVGERAPTGLAGIGAGIASFVGQTAASANPLNFQQDPLWVASLFVPAGGATGMAMKLLETAIAGGTLNAAQDIMFSGPKAKALGEQSPDLFSDVLSGAVGALAFKGLHLAASEITSRFLPKITGSPDFASPEKALYDFLTKAEPDLSNVTDQNTLLRLFRQLPYSEGNAAADANLTNEFMTREASPFPDDRAGVAATQDAVTNAYDILNNGPEGARVFNPDSTIFASGPTEDQVVRDVVSQKTPEVYDRLDQIKTELSDAQTQLEQAVANYQNFSTGKDFDTEVQKVRDQLNSGLAEVEQIRKEGRQSPDHPAVVGEIARLKEQATKQVVDIGSARFTTKTMLQGELKDARAKVAAAGKRLKRAGAAVASAEAKARAALGNKVPQAEKVAAARTLGARPDTSGVLKAVDTFVPADEVERIVKNAQASAKEALTAGVDEVTGKAIAPSGTFDIGSSRISTDMQVPGPDSLRPALKVMEEIQDEQDLKDAATRCGLGG